MKQEIKKQWIAALMGDEYKQGQRALRSVHEGEVTYCCLGVLCDIYSKETGTPWIPERDSEVFRMLNLSGTLPDAVQEWSGMRSSHLLPNNKSLVACNDSDGMSFADIAKLIEEQL